MRDRTTRVGVASGLLSLIVLAVGCSAPSPVNTPPQTTAAAAPPRAPTEQPGTTTPQEAPAPLPISEGEIPARADFVASSLRRIEALIEPRTAMAEVSEEIGRRELQIENLRGDLDGINPDRITARRLQDMRLPWLAIQNELAGWRRSADARFEALRNGREYLREVRAQWEATRDSAVEQQIGDELTTRVNEVLARVIDVETRVRARRDAVAAMIDRIATAQEAVIDALAQIDSIAAEVRNRALLRDAPPIWQALRAPQPSSFASESLGAGLRWEHAVLNFFRLYPGRLAALVVVFALALALALRGRRQARAMAPSATELQDARILFERPVSVAVAGTLVVSLMLLPAASGSANDVLFLIIVVPVVRLGSVLLEERTRRTLWTVVLLTVASVVASLLPSGLLISRLLLMAVTGAAAVVALRAARTSRTEVPARGWTRAVPALATIFAVILGVALLANLLGWANLSRRLMHATISSAFGAIGWAIVVAAFAALLPALIAGPVGAALPSLRREKPQVIRISLLAASLLALVTWLRGTLVRFDVLAPLRELLRSIGALQLSAGSLTVSAGELIAAAILLIVTAVVARLVRFVLRGEIVPRLRLGRGLDASVVTLTNYTIWALGIALAASAAGLSGTQLAVVIGALGVGIGFGLQTIVNNFVSGLILIFERPIKVGDAIETPDYLGRVRRIGIRASVIRSYDGAEIVVPNGELISKAVTNWTGTDENRRVDIPVGVAYGTDPEKVLAILRGVAEAHPRVADVPPPDAQMVGFGDSSLDFRLRAWCAMEHRIDVASDLHVAINRELAVAGIEVPFPQRDLHIKSNAEAKIADPPEGTE